MGWWKYWELERLHKLPKTTQPVSGSPGVSDSEAPGLALWAALLRLMQENQQEVSWEGQACTQRELRKS